MLMLCACSTIIKAGELVRLLTPEEQQTAAEASQEAGSSWGRRGGGQPAKSRGGSRWVNTRIPAGHVYCSNTFM